jgi:probable selenium-dependent hydroxylase accessory protein YqeC
MAVAFFSRKDYILWMRTTRCNFDDALRPHLPGLICLVGGGGKTTLLYALGDALGTVEAPVLCTTTTRIFPPTAEQCPAVLVTTAPQKIKAPQGIRFFCAARPAPADSGKLMGFSPEELASLAKKRPDRIGLIEADGAAHRPIKAPAEHEPVIPPTTKVVVAVLGLSGLGRALTENFVFRPERVAAITGLAPGEICTPEAVSHLFLHPQGLFQHTPPGTARFVFLNQADLPGAAEAGEKLAELILRGDPEIRGVHIGAVAVEGLRCTQMLP